MRSIGGRIATPADPAKPPNSIPSTCFDGAVLRGRGHSRRWRHGVDRIARHPSACAGQLPGCLDWTRAKLRLIYMDGSGSYGTNGNGDVAFEAALLSRELRRPAACAVDAGGRARVGSEGPTAATGSSRYNSALTATSPHGKRSQWCRRILQTSRTSRCSRPLRRGLMTARDYFRACCRSMLTHLIRLRTCGPRSGGRRRRRIAPFKSPCAGQDRQCFRGSKVFLTSSRPRPARTRSPIGSASFTILATVRF